MKLFNDLTEEEKIKTVSKGDLSKYNMYDAHISMSEFTGETDGHLIIVHLSGVVILSSYFNTDVLKNLKSKEEKLEHLKGVEDLVVELAKEKYNLRCDPTAHTYVIRITE